MSIQEAKVFTGIPAGILFTPTEAGEKDQTPLVFRLADPSEPTVQLGITIKGEFVLIHAALSDKPPLFDAWTILANLSDDQVRTLSSHIEGFVGLTPGQVNGENIAVLAQVMGRVYALGFSAGIITCTKMGTARISQLIAESVVEYMAS